MTIAFYCSVHCIEAHPAVFGHHSSSHEDRYDKMSWVGVPDTVYASHEQLQEWSHQARYLMRRFPLDFYDGTVLRYLDVVADYVGLSMQSQPEEQDPTR